MSTSSPSLSLPRGLARGRERTGAGALARMRPELALLLVVAAALDLWGLGRNGLANEYYSAAVRSMSTSWHAFLYGSFDSAGVMTVDKPPLALWVQALSARVFGFGAWSMLVPQALMGVATVGLTYDLVRRRFGRLAAVAGGLALALTPTTVAVSRHNNPDALLVLCCVAALWCLVRGLDDGRTRWIVLAGVEVGLGFEAKMGVALLVVPGIALAWLWVAPRGRGAAARSLLLGGGAMALVGLAWPVLMWLTPAADRPWISGTSDNSIWSLIVDYNGLGRVLGQSGGPGGGIGGPAGGPGPGGSMFGGASGPLRLLNESLGGQGGWLLGFALVVALGLAALTRLRRTDARTGWLVAVGGSFLVTAAAFSQAQGIFHPYYVSLLAPFTGALVGAGLGAAVAGGRGARVLAAAAIAGGAVTEFVVLGHVSSRFAWLPALLGADVAVAALLPSGATSTRGRAAVVSAALGLLLLAPATWAVQTLGHATSGAFPMGGPASAGMGGFGGPGGLRFRGAAGGPPPAFARAGGAPGMPGGASARGLAGGGGPFGGDTEALPSALRYVKARGGGTIAVSSQSGAAGSVITSGADVAAIGGFSGRESQVSVSWLADAVASGKIRWVLTDGAGGGFMRDSRIGSREVMAVATQVGTPAGSVSGLYDLQGKAGALRAAGG